MILKSSILQLCTDSNIRKNTILKQIEDVSNQNYK